MWPTSTQEYLLRELASQGFLPGHGFPTHITAFDNLTVTEFKRNQQEQKEKPSREDNRFQRRELANRDWCRQRSIVRAV